MNIARVVGQGDNKKDPPKWVTSLPWRVSAPPPPSEPALLPPTVPARVLPLPPVPAADAATAIEPAPSAIGFMYSFDFLSGQATRVASKPGSVPEPSVKVVPSNNKETDPPIATWADGFTRNVMELSNAELLELQATRSGSRVSIHIEYDEKHSVSGNRITVKVRQDRHVLMCLFEQSKQRLQVRVDIFPGADAHRAVALMMTEIAREYVANKIEAGDLTKLRDERLKTLGLSIRSPAAKADAKPKDSAMKRPAAATV
jgi:hypothetical protein